MRSRRVPTLPPLSITEEERAELQRRVRAHTTPQRAAKRARVVLLAADGVPNQVELFFSILARRLLKRGEFASVEDLVGKVMAFIADYNRTAKPFRWTYDGRPLKAN
jgi:hypothetical protein